MFISNENLVHYTINFKLDNMKLLEKILFPIDVNTDTKEQLNSAIKIAQLCDSKIFMMHVIPDEGLSEEIQKIVIDHATEALNKIGAIFKNEGIEVSEPIIERGKPVDKILKMAAQEHVDLILTGCGNNNEREKFKRGSTVAELMRQSDIPVWVVKSSDVNKLENILCPVDFSEPSKYALNSAILLSKFFAANLTILGVYEPYASLSPLLNLDIDEVNSSGLKEIKNEMNEFIKDFDLKGIKHKIEIKTGAAHEEILKTIKTEGHDLLIIGTHGRSGLQRFVMGSVTEKVTREVPCSFITTRNDVIIQLQFDNDLDEIHEIEQHFKKANELVRDAFYKEAIGKYLICLEINSLHIPSMFKVSNVFKMIDDHAQAIYYSDMAKDVLTRLWDEEMEREISQHYLPSN